MRFLIVIQNEIKALRLGNNSITEMNSICNPILLTLKPDLITWLDLSFNSLTQIDVQVAEGLPNLTTLYLHANRISKISNVKKLANFSSLKSVTLYGNPIEENKHYRNMVLYVCPKLIQLDFSPITSSQRDKVFLRRHK